MTSHLLNTLLQLLLTQLAEQLRLEVAGVLLFARHRRAAVDLVHLAESGLPHIILDVLLLGVLVLLINQSGNTIKDLPSMVTLVDVDDFALVRYVEEMLLIDQHLKHRLLPVTFGKVLLCSIYLEG